MKSLVLVTWGLCAIGIGYSWHLQEVRLEHEKHYGEYKEALAKIIDQEGKETIYEQKIEEQYNVELFVEHDMKTITYLEHHLKLIADQGLMNSQKKVEIVIPQGENKKFVIDRIAGLYKHNQVQDQNPLIFSREAKFDVLVHEYAHFWHYQMPKDQKKEFESQLNEYLKELKLLSFEDNDNMYQWKPKTDFYGVYPSAYANSSLAEYVAEIVENMFVGFYFNQGGLSEASDMMKLDWKNISEINKLLGKYGFISKDMEQFYNVYCNDASLRKWRTHKEIQAELRLMGYGPSIDEILNNTVQYRLFEDVGNIDSIGLFAGDAKLLDPKRDYSVIENNKKLAYDIIYSAYILQDFSYLFPSKASKERILLVTNGSNHYYTESSYMNTLKANSTLTSKLKDIVTNTDLTQAVLHYIDIEAERGEKEVMRLVDHIKGELKNKKIGYNAITNYSRPCLYVAYHLLAQENNAFVHEQKAKCESELKMLYDKGSRKSYAKYLQVLNHYDVVMDTLAIPLEETYINYAQNILIEHESLYNTIDDNTKHITQKVLRKYFSQKYPLIFK